MTRRPQFRAAVLAGAVALICGCAAPEETEESGWQREMERLKSLPYASLSGAGDDTDTGTTLHVEEKTQPGYHLYLSRVTNDIFLSDLEGRIVRTWSFPEGNPPPSRFPRASGASPGMRCCSTTEAC